MKIPVYFIGICTLLAILGESSQAQAQVLDSRLFTPHRKLDLPAAYRFLDQIYQKKTSTVFPFCGCPTNQKGSRSQLACGTPSSLTWLPVMPPSIYKKKGAAETNLDRHADLHNLFPATADSLPCHATNDWPLEQLKKSIRGDVARAWFYMSIQYGISIPGPLEDRLRMWHLMDPPSPWEERRNTLIEDAQGNRNPFIDHPALVERVPHF
jgi:hypothetical protein